MITSYDRLIHRMVNWSKIHGNLHATFVVGSRARVNSQIDLFSDLDLILFSDSPSGLVRSEAWISTIAKPWIWDFKQTFAGDAEWQVIYEGGLKVDFVITKSVVADSTSQIVKGSPYLEIFNRGWKQLYLRPELPSSFSSISPSIGNSITPVNHRNSLGTQLSHGLFLSFGLAKSIFRNDLWRAHNYLCQLRAQILLFMEIQARSKAAREVDTWDDGRHIEKWADQALVKRLPSLFPDYNQEALAKSFHFALRLLDEVVSDIASVKGEKYPTSGQQAALVWLDKSIPL